MLWSESVCAGITGERFISPTIEQYGDVEWFGHAAMLKKWEKSLAPYTEIVPYDVRSKNRRACSRAYLL